MRAIVAHAAKDLRIEDARTPPLGPLDVRVRVGFGGICGSDLHYYNHGGFGVVRLREPMILGHEVAGVVEAAGAEAGQIKVGDRVAINPSVPCNRCRYCLEGLQNQCLDMRFYGSAMRFPHVQGAFREVLVCRDSQAHPIGAGTTLQEAAMAEPLAVALHATTAGRLADGKARPRQRKRTDRDCAIAARRAGAAEIVVTDIADGVLSFAARVGADRVINVARNPDALAAFAADKGYFDALFEASGAEAALRSGIDAVRPRGVIVQLGLGGDMTIPINFITAKEIELRGTFRFHEEFALALEFIGKGLIEVKPLITETMPLEKACDAFELASDRSQSMKVQIAF